MNLTLTGTCARGRADPAAEGERQQPGRLQRRCPVAPHDSHDDRIVSVVAGFMANPQPYQSL
eukprot:350413-Chlamydomonas_euryale.AAC.16